jgi:hypothetical protein
MVLTIIYVIKELKELLFYRNDRWSSSLLLILLGFREAWAAKSGLGWIGKK